MKEQDETYRPKVTGTEQADRDAHAAAVKIVSNSRDLPMVITLFVLIAFAILRLVGVL